MKRSVERREQILQELMQKPFASVSDLAQTFQCSQMTIRRDLERLESEGMIERSHGGATASRRITLEFSMGEKADVRREEKRAIARSAAALVKPDERIIIDTGTTTLALARELRYRGHITVVTTSLAVVSSLLSADGIECMLLGGVVRDSTPDLYGPLLEDNLSHVHPDWAFIGCDGISVKGGLTTSDVRIARATSLMISGASKVVLLTDSTKAGKDSFMKFADLDDLDILITDTGMPEPMLEAVRNAGVDTILVEPDKPTEGV